MKNTVFPGATRTAAGYHEVEPRAVQAFPAAARIVDVRNPEEWTSDGRLPGAELVPLPTLPERASAWDRRQPVLVVCRSGGRSSAAAQHLVGRGFENVYNMRGGMLAWAGSDLPVQR